MPGWRTSGLVNSVKESVDGSRILKIGTNDRMLITRDGRKVLAFKGDKNVSGWQRGAWVLTPATKKDIEAVLGRTYFNTEMKALGIHLTLGGHRLEATLRNNEKSRCQKNLGKAVGVAMLELIEISP